MYEYFLVYNINGTRRVKTGSEMLLRHIKPAVLEQLEARAKKKLPARYMITDDFSIEVKLEPNGNAR